MDDQEKKHLFNLRRHFLTGVSYMVPLVVAGGILIAISFLVGGYLGFEEEGSFASYLNEDWCGCLGSDYPDTWRLYCIFDRR